MPAVSTHVSVSCDRARDPSRGLAFLIWITPLPNKCFSYPRSFLARHYFFVERFESRTFLDELL